MEVVEACSAHLTNIETLEMLKKNAGYKYKDLATILYETTSYLESSPASKSTKEKLAKFKHAIHERNLNLKPLEVIQLANLQPENITELHLMIDNIEDKLDDNQREQILNLVKGLETQPEENPRKKQKT